MKALNLIAYLCLAMFFNTGVVQASPHHEDEYQCTEENFTNCLDGVGPAVTNPDTVRNTANKLVDKLNKASNEESSNVAFIGQSALSGMAAGDAFSGWGVWASYGNTGFDADIPINSTVQPVASYEAHQYNFFGGVDRFLLDSMVVGMAFSYENTDIDTAYNGGNNRAVGYTFAPYLAYMLNDMFSVDAVAGFTNLEYDTDRIDNVSGGVLSGNFDADRWFVATNFNVNYYKENWIFTARVGYLYTEEEQDAYQERGPNTPRTLQERHIDLSQVSFSAGAAYAFERVEPYIALAYYNDLGRDDGNGAGGLPGSVGATQPQDDDELQTMLGFRYYGDVVTGSLEWIKVLDRDTFSSDSFIITIRADL